MASGRRRPDAPSWGLSEMIRRRYSTRIVQVRPGFGQTGARRVLTFGQTRARLALRIGAGGAEGRDSSCQAQSYAALSRIAHPPVWTLRHGRSASCSVPPCPRHQFCTEQQHLPRRVVVVAALDVIVIVHLCRCSSHRVRRCPYAYS